MSLLEELKKRQANGFAPAAPAPMGAPAPAVADAPQPALTPGDVNLVPSMLSPDVATQTPAYSPTGGAGFLPATSVPVPATRTADATFMGDVSTLAEKAGEASARLDAGAEAYSARGRAMREAQAAGTEATLSSIGSAIAGQIGTPEFARPEMATPASVAGLSVTGGAPLTPEAITSPQVATPTGGVAPAAAPAVELSAPAPQAGGGITKDGVFYPTQPEPEAGPSGMTRGGVFTPTQQPTGALKTFEDNLKATIAAGGETPQMAAQRASEASPSASASQVALAESAMQQQEAERAADRAAEEYGKSLPLGGGSIGERDEKIAQYRAMALSEAQKGIGEGATGASRTGGLTVDQQLKVDKMNYDRARDTKEDTAASQEIKTKESDLYNLHQDSFKRQERYINQALENTGLLSTGFAAISKFLPGTPARQLEESLKPILGEAAFGRLQQMRDASKTGGALGQVSERELGLLESAMGALSTSQNESQFRANLLAYRKQMRESNARIQEKYKEMQSGGSSGKAAPRYDNDQNVGDSAESYYNPSK